MMWLGEADEMPHEGASLDNGALDPSDAGHRRRDVDVVKSAFSSLQTSKGAVLDRIKGLRIELEDSLRARLRIEAELKDSNRKLEESKEKIRLLEEELSALKGDLGTAQTMLDEIDRTIR